jgi:hypothetical protein
VRSGFFRRGMLGAIVGAIAASLKGADKIPSVHETTNPDLPKSNRVGGGHHGSKRLSDSTPAARARHRFEKRRRRNSRRVDPTTRGIKL